MFMATKIVAIIVTVPLKAKFLITNHTLLFALVLPGHLLQFSADVLACNLRPDGEVEVLDTWNLDEGRGNVRDDVDDTLMFASSVVDGRIKCS